MVLASAHKVWLSLPTKAGEGDVYRATTTFKVVPGPELAPALAAWRDHVRAAHPTVRFA